MLRVLAFVVPVLLGAAGSPAGAAPSFVAEACEVPHLTAALTPRLRCGTVAVPRDYARPGAGTYKLAVVVIQSARQPAPPDPVAYISGGPGGPLTVYAAYQAEHPLAAGRDIVLLDQRGTGRSEPALCPSLDDRFADALAAAAADPAGEAPRRALFAACRTEALAQGIDLTGFGTAVTVEDFDRVRRALGIARWNVFGVSYGTTVAMTLMARHPDTVRAAVLDSINPPDPVLPPWSVNVADATAAFLASCAEQPSCRAPYPDLPGLYRDTVDRLRESPLPLPDGAWMTADLFQLVVGRMVYFPRFYPGLPRLIAHVHEGATQDAETARNALLADARDRDTGSNFAANAAVDCRDRPRFRQAPGTTPLDRIALYDICPAWAPLGPAPVIPEDTPVPTLMLAGEFDPNARPDASRRVAETMGPHVQWVEVAGGGHSVRSSNPCAAALVRAFIDDPDGTVDASCAARPAPVRFLPP